MDDHTRHEVMNRGEGVSHQTSVTPDHEPTGRNPGLPLEEIRARLRALLPSLREKYGVHSLEIFGSYVRGEAGPQSDLDLLVTFESAPTLFQLITLELFLSETLGVKVDLVMKESLKPELRESILREAEEV